MKIRVVCKDNARYEFLRRALVEKDRAGQVSGGVLALDSLPSVINGSAPDMLIVDDAADSAIDAVEALSLGTPGIDTLLISDDASAEFLMRAMRAGVREVIPTAGGKDALHDALGRIMAKRDKQLQAGRPEGKILAFLSCKGGSGATFLAANFAYVMASEYGQRVALIDLNLQFGDAAIFVSDAPTPSNVAELSQQIHRLDSSLLSASMLEVAPNFFVLAAPENPAHATDVTREHVQAIIQLARKDYDFVVIDVPRSLDSVSLQALDMADTIFPVLQLTLPYVRDGKRLLGIFRSLDYPRSKIQVLVNRYEKGGELTLEDLEKAIDEKVTHVVPNSYTAAAASVNLGIPIAKGNRANPISKVLIEMGREFVQTEEKASGGRWFARLFSRTGGS